MKLQGNDGFERELPSAGNHHAMCYAVIDLGEQKPYRELEKDFKTGQMRKACAKFKLMLMFELDERITTGDWAGQRFGLSREFTATAFEKGALATTVAGWLGIKLKDGDDPEALLVGHMALVNVVHKTKGEGNDAKTFANIAAITPPMPGTEPWELENGKSVANWKFPKWVQAKRDEALTKPSDYGCQWDTISDTSFDTEEFEGQAGTMPTPPFDTTGLAPTATPTPAQQPVQAQEPVQPTPSATGSTAGAENPYVQPTTTGAFDPLKVV